MTVLSRLMQRMLLPAGTEDRDRELREAQVAKASAKRAVDNACARLAKQGAIIHKLAADVVERNEEAKDR